MKPSPLGTPQLRRKRLFAGTFIHSIWVAVWVGSTACSAQSISLTHFRGSDSWPVFSPGEIPFQNEALDHIRVGYDALFQGQPPLAGYMNVDRAMFNGRPSLWVEWMFTSENEGSSGWANMDLLVLDRETGALLSRLAPTTPRGDWGGPYHHLEARPDEMRHLIMGTDGSAEVRAVPLEGPIFDFGALGFVLPFLSLEPGSELQLRAYGKSLGDSVQALAVKGREMVTVLDAQNAEHAALAVDVLPPTRHAVITFFVSDAAPFFLGWDYRDVESGESLFEMRYRGHVLTAIPPSAGPSGA